MDIADKLKSEGEWRELPNGREQLNAEENIDESHAMDYPEDEKSDSCSKTEKAIDADCLEKMKTTPRSTTKKKV